MIRFVIGPDRAVVPDLAERLPGRGIWLSATRDVLQAACARGAFAKAARGPVTVPQDFSDLLQAALARRIVELLGLARRAGLMVQAADGSPEERRRCLSSARAAVAAHAPLDAAALGAVFGRDHAVHVAVAPGGLADRIGIECLRLAGLAPDAAAHDKVPDDGMTLDGATHHGMTGDGSGDNRNGPADLLRRDIQDA